MSVQKSGCAAPIVARHWPAPVGVVTRNAAGVRGIVARVVEDPAARFFRAGQGHALERIGGVERLAAGIGQVGNASRAGHGGGSHARPLRVRPGSVIAAAYAKVYAVGRNPQISRASRVLLDELLEFLAAHRTNEK